MHHVFKLMALSDALNTSLSHMHDFKTSLVLGICFYLLTCSFLFTNLGRPFNAQHCSPMVPRWPCSIENAGPASLSPRPTWGSQKKKHKAKNHEDCNPIKECRKKTGTERETYELKKKKTSPAHPCHRPLPNSKTEMPVPTV